MGKIARDHIAYGPPISSTSIILDNASGPGIILGEILAQSASIGTPKLYAMDISPVMIEMLQKKKWPGVESEVMDAQALTYSDNKFTHIFMSMGIFLLPDPEKGAKEMYRTLQPGGAVVVSSIKQIGWVTIFQAAQMEVKPESPLFKSPLKEEWSTKEKLISVLEAGGFKAADIEIKVGESSIPSNELELLMRSMRGPVTGMITGTWTEEEKGRFEVALDKQMEKEMKNPRELEVVYWIAIAKK